MAFLAQSHNEKYLPNFAMGNCRAMIFDKKGLNKFVMKMPGKAKGGGGRILRQSAAIKLINNINPKKYRKNQTRITATSRRASYGTKTNSAGYREST
jgi:hypothetical protein